eukprot:gene804-445_t
MSGLKKFIRHSSMLLSQASRSTPVVGLESIAKDNKYVFFYFSASWCPPCRQFTPQLAEFYAKHKTAKQFEVVLVPWDEEKPAFDEYYAKMPWLSLPFEDREGMQFLTKGFQVESIPTMIGVEAESGNVITTNARTMVVRDPEAKEFPWEQQ